MRSEGKLLMLTLGLYISFLNWGYFQERISSTDYSEDVPIESSVNKTESETRLEGRWTFAIVLHFSMAAMCCLISIPFVLLGGGDAPTVEKFRKKMHPDSLLVLPAITQTLASPFGFLSLRYITYPTLLLMKSSKLMPVMFVSYFLNEKRYSKNQIVSVVLISTGITLFSCILDPISLIIHGDKTNMLRQEQHYAPLIQTIVGFSLVSINLLLDGFTNAYQDRHRIAFPSTSPFFMMYHINLWQSIFLFSYLLLAFILTRVAPDLDLIPSQLDKAFFFMKEYPPVVNDLIWFSLFGATGQIFIFNIIIAFGSLACVKVCLTRKFFSILISILVFGHNVQWWQWLGVAIVFSGLLLNLFDTYQYGKKEVPLVQNKKDL